MTPTSVDSLLTVWEKLGMMERSVLNTLAWRLYSGQRKYGKLEENKKEWTWEAAEEGLDQAVYLAASLVAVTEAGKRRYFSELDGGHYSVLSEPEPVLEPGDSSLLANDEYEYDDFLGPNHS
jgi:hypothetical protein